MATHPRSHPLPRAQAKAGVPRTFIAGIFEGRMERYSPQLWFQGCVGAWAPSAPTRGGALTEQAPGMGAPASFPPLDPARMPAVSLFHGALDACVPPSASVDFAAALAAAGVPASATVFAGGAGPTERLRGRL